jgi:dihydroflavonol-4-reductase
MLTFPFFFSQMILVTGASGFVGQHLVRLLSSKGMKVRALYNNTPPGKNLIGLEGVHWVKCDLLDVYDVEEAIQDIVEIYHCAGIVSFDPSDKEQLLHFNVESTANLVNQALEQSIRKFIFISSVAALGRSEDEHTEITEEEQWEESKYNSAYGLSKHLAEMEVWRGIGEGLNAAIVNPATILGTGDWDKGSARLIKVVDREFPFYTMGVTAWVDVNDVVNAAYLLMNSDIEAERFIISAGNYSFREIFTQMAHALGRKPPHIKANALIAGLVWRWNALRKALTGRTVTVTKETARTAQRTSTYSNKKFLEYFPQFTYTPIHQTIADMAREYRNSAG